MLRASLIESVVLLPAGKDVTEITFVRSPERGGRQSRHRYRVSNHCNSGHILLKECKQWTIGSGCRGESASIGAEAGGNDVRRWASSLELLRSRNERQRSALAGNSRRAIFLCQARIAASGARQRLADLPLNVPGYMTKPLNRPTRQRKKPNPRRIRDPPHQT